MPAASAVGTGTAMVMVINIVDWVKDFGYVSVGKSTVQYQQKEKKEQIGTSRNTCCNKRDTVVGAARAFANLVACQSRR